MTLFLLLFSLCRRGTFQALCDLCDLCDHVEMRITLDLDDGVKVNYCKFGDLLAEVKAITGGASDD